MKIDLLPGADASSVLGLIRDLEVYGCQPKSAPDQISFELPTDPVRSVALVGFLPNLLDQHGSVVAPPKRSQRHGRQHNA